MEIHLEGRVGRYAGWQAALLHDIGKFRERALGAKSDPQAKYTHEKHSQEFVFGLKSFLGDEPLRKMLGDAVLRHHSPQYRDELLVSAVDIIAADERAESEGQAEETTRFTAPLESILARIWGYEDSQVYFPLKPLALDTETIFARPESHVSQEAYKRYWLSFHQEAQKLLPQDWQGLFYLLKKYLWCVVSSASRGEIHDISLFDHLRVTAAIAACLHHERCSEDELNKIRKGAPEERGKERFLLLKGDISGIQNFIYTITSKGAAKGLRGRSVYLQILTEVIANWILERLQMPFVNLLYQGGGHFMLLLPANSEENLQDLRRELAKKLFAAHSTDLYVALGWTLLNANDFGPKRFAKKWQEASEKVEQAKRQRFVELESGLFDQLFQSQSHQRKADVCDICQAEDPLGLISDKKDDREFKKCHLCKSFEDLGNDVARARYLMLVQLKDEQKEDTHISSCQDVLAQFGYRVAFLQELEPTIPGARHVGLYRLNDTDFLTQEMLDWAQKVRESGVSTSLGFRFLANVTPLQDDKILDFDDLAKQSTGITRVGILRMDVDNLGQIFGNGIPNATISRIATVSSMLQLFFEGWVHRAAEVHPNKIYAIYSGGDDLFFVGAWDAIVELAWKIRKDFREFTGNEQVTLSAGIAVEEAKFPLYQAARNAGNALEAAKALPRKNAISLLGKPLDWANFERARHLKERLVALLQGRNGKSVPRGLLTKLANIYALHKKYPDRPRWTVRLLYDVTRLGESHKEFKNELQALQMMIGRDGLIDFLDLPVRWAEMLTIQREERRRS